MGKRNLDNDLPNIGDVLKHYGAQLRRTHGQTNLKCPFHSDTHQSGTANLDTNVFICFACGVQGNSLQIIAQQERVDIREAKRIAEGITGTSSEELRGKHISGRKLPQKSWNNNGGGTSGSIRRSRGA